MDFDRIPNDAIFHIFSFLHFNDILNICVVRKVWDVSVCARSDRFWRGKYEEFVKETFSLEKLKKEEKRELKSRNGFYEKYKVVKVAHRFYGVYIGNISKPRTKIVMIGDGNVGKTSLLIRFYKKRYQESFVPTIFENQLQEVSYCSRTVGLDLWDTAMPECFTKVIPPYALADVFILCYDISDRCSFSNLKEKWKEEVQCWDHFCSKYILCSTKFDLREDKETKKELEEMGEKIISTEEGQRMAEELGCYGFIETSAKTGKNIDNLFMLCLDSAFKRPEEKIEKKKGGCSLM